MSDEGDCRECELQLAAPRRINGKWFTKVQIIATSINLVVRLTASFVAAAFDGWIPKQRRLFQKLKNLFCAPSVFIYSTKISFSSFTITHRSSQFDFLYQAISKPIGRRPNTAGWFVRKSVVEPSVANVGPEQSVHVDILHDPSPKPIRADVIFIHGLHGSLYNTWKQGLWSHRKEVKNLPLKHKYQLRGREPADVYDVLSETNSDGLGNRKPFSSVQNCNTEYVQLLDSITDLINNIDDTIKNSKVGKREKEEPYTPCWPRDWLPKDCPNVRVIAVNYTTDPFLWRPVWISKRVRSSISQRSQEMEDLLLELGVGKNPVIWVGHSKGGLYVKQMLVDAGHTDDPSLANFLGQTKGIMFYSVPHRGSSLAHWTLPLLRQSVELTEVKKDCREVLDLHDKFLKLFEEKCLSAEVFSFVETILTFMFVTNVRVVTVDSADLGLGSFRGVNIDHREICKPLNRNCFLYTELTKLINRVA